MPNSAAFVAHAVLTAAQLNALRDDILSNTTGHDHSGAADHGVLLKTSAINLGLFNVLDYGAVGDGTHDDTTAIQAAITACPASGTVLFPTPSSYYKTTAPLVVSANRITLICHATAMIVNVSTGDVIQITGTGVTLEGLYINGGSGHGVYVNGGYGLTMRRLTVETPGTDCVFATGTWWILTEACVFDAGNVSSGYSAFHHDNASNNIVHLRSRFYGGHETGARIKSGANISFIGCDFSGDTGSLGLSVLGGYNIVVQGCYFENTAGIDLAGTTAPIYNAAIRDSYMILLDNNQVGITVHKAINVSIAGNFITNNGVGSGQVGISIIGNDLGAQNIVIDRGNSLFTPITILDPAGRADSLYGHRVSHGATAPQDGSLWEVGDIRYNTVAASLGYVGWVCITAGRARKETWTTGHTYVAGDWIQAGNAAPYAYYVCKVGGVAGATEPTHVTGDASDGGVTWTYATPNTAGAVFATFGVIT
jgi:hypothetical protein